MSQNSSLAKSTSLEKIQFKQCFKCKGSGWISNKYDYTCIYCYDITKRYNVCYRCENSKSKTTGPWIECDYCLGAGEIKTK